MNDEWRTPLDLFQKLDDEFSFDVDLCTNGENSLCSKYSTDVEMFLQKGEDKAGEVYWMNPPYSRGNIGKCMETAYHLSENHTVVCLVRFDPSAKWFQKWVDDRATEVRMLDRRVKFQGADSAYNFPCCIVVYHARDNDQLIMTEYFIWGWK